MSSVLSPALQKEWEKEFYEKFLIHLRYLDFGCENSPLIVYDILEDVEMSSRLSFLLSLRFEIRLKYPESPFRYFGMIYPFFSEKYGIVTSSLKSSETSYEREKKTLIKRYEFQLKTPFEIKLGEYLI